MATYRNTVSDASATVALGSPGLLAGDIIEYTKFANDYTSGADFSGTDLLTTTLGVGFEGSFQSALGAPLKLQCNRTSTGAFWNRSNSRRVDLQSSANTVVIYTVHQAGGGLLTMDVLKCNALWASGGQTVINTNVDLTTLHATKSARVAMKKSAGSFVPAVNVYDDAFFRCESDIGATVLRGGTLEIFELTCTMTSLTVTGGIFRPIECGAVGNNATFEGCVIDFSQLQQALTFGGTVVIGPGVKILYKKGGIEPTWTVSYSSVNPEIEYR